MLKTIKIVIGLIIFIPCKIFFLEGLLIKLYNHNTSATHPKYNIVTIIFFFYYNFLFFIGDKKLDRFIHKSYLKISNQGLDVAKYYYETNNHLKNITKKNFKTSTYYIFSCFKKNIKKIKKKNKKVYLVNIGSSSGRDMEYLNQIENKINFISTDITKKILDFQKKHLKVKGVEFYKVPAQKINKILFKKNIYNNCKIIFANGCIQYLPPNQFEDFFENLKKNKNIYFLSSQPINNKILKGNNLNSYKGTFTFQYKYEKYLKLNGFKILEKKIFFPNTKNFGIGKYFIFAFKS